MVEGRGGKERCSFRTRTGAYIFVWWKGGVENDGLGRSNCMLLDQRHIARTRTGASKSVGGRTGWIRTVFLLHTCQYQTSFIWGTSCCEGMYFLRCVLCCLHRVYELLAMYTVPFVERTITSVMRTVPPAERTLVICMVPPVERISVLVRCTVPGSSC